MALENTEELAKENGLTAKQVTAVTGHANTWHDATVAELKGGWDTKANTDAQGILDGALSMIVKNTGVQRNDGEKAGDYIPRAWGDFSKTGQSEIDTLKLDYEEKLKNFDGDSGTKEALLVAETKLDEAQKKYANYDELTGYKEKFDTLSTEHLSMKEEVCFGKVKPAFPNTVNEYEGKAKWNTFVADVKKGWNIELVDGEPTVISKENKHKTMLLSDLVKANDVISELSKGRTQEGTNSSQTDNVVTIEGVPFPVPENCDAKKRSELIQAHLATKGIAKHSPQYSKEFGDLNSKIITKQQTA